jgi:ubiquinone biosynthesis protein UbiJ
VDIDCEELLSKLVGDVVAHQAGQATRSVSGWLKETAEAMQMNTAEYLSEETDTTPTESEVGDFMDQVDEVRMNIDRLEARIKLLQNNKNTD